MAETDRLREGLRQAAEALGLSPRYAQLERTATVVAAALRSEMRRSEAELPDLGETEPAFGLRFDVGDLRGERDEHSEHGENTESGGRDD